MIAGVASCLVAISYLISFGFRSVKIRKKHLSIPRGDSEY
jgi:hypothetical protein